MTDQKFKPVYLIDGTRTPLLKATERGPFSASDLAVQAGRVLLSRYSFDPTEIGETVFGCMMPSEDEANIGRLIGLRLGCGKETPGWTVQRNCASGMQAIDSAMKDIQLGRHDLVLAGGTETMSRAPVIYRPHVTDWFGRLAKSKSFGAKLATMARMPLGGMLNPIIALLRGLTDPLVGVNMGQTAEILAYQFNISREEMDAFSLRSHQRLAKAFDAGYMKEVEAIYDANGKFYTEDTGMRRDTTLEKLAKLKPNFDKKFGRVTPGNSSQVTDGAAVVLLASEEGVKKYNLPVLAKIVDVNWGALSPEVMGLGPVMATTPMLIRNQLTLNDIDYWELNEAFAAQVIGCLRAWESKEFCAENLGLDKAFGSIDQEKLNVDGGAIACGHPIGCTGTRIVLHLAHVLKRNNAKYGVATLCIGGGQGGAVLLEV